MNFWKFVTPRMLGFSIRTASQFAVDKIRGAPTRPVQVAQYVASNARAGDPKDVLRTIDRFAREERWLMNVGPDKGPLIQELAEWLPNDARILELGAYCGYSSIMLASAFGEAARVVSIEIDENGVEKFVPNTPKDDTESARPYKMVQAFNALTLSPLASPISFSSSTKNTSLIS